MSAAARTLVDIRIQAGLQLASMEKQAGWGLIARGLTTAGKWALPKLVKYLPRILGKTSKKWLPGALRMIGRGALGGAKRGLMWGGGMGALSGALGARARGESMLWGGLKGGVRRGLGGMAVGGLLGGIGGGLRYKLAPRMYRGAQVMMKTPGKGGRYVPIREQVRGLTAAKAREIAAAGGRFTGRTGERLMLQPKGMGRVISWLPGAAATGLDMVMPGGGEGGAPRPTPASAVQHGGMMPAQYGMMPVQYSGMLPGMQGMRYAPTPGMRRAAFGLSPGAGVGGYGMQRYARAFGGMMKEARLDSLKSALEKAAIVLYKQAQLPQYGVRPLSAKTAIADFIANRRYVPEQNEYTGDEQALIGRLLAGMSRSSARVVDARRRGRLEGERGRERVIRLLRTSGLWG